MPTLCFHQHQSSVFSAGTGGTRAPIRLPKQRLLRPVVTLGGIATSQLVDVVLERGHVRKKGPPGCLAEASSDGGGSGGSSGGNREDGNSKAGGGVGGKLIVVLGLDVEGHGKSSGVRRSVGELAGAVAVVTPMARRPR